MGEIRAHDCEGPLTVPEIDEWIEVYLETEKIELGPLTYGAIRMAIKQQPGVRFENRRLIADPVFDRLRWRHEVRRLGTPERAWVFFIDPDPTAET